MPAIYLANDVHWCDLPDAAIFLDARTDQYILAEPAVAALIRAHVADERLDVSEAGFEALQGLLGAGVLTTEHAKGRPWRRLSHHPDQVEVAGPDVRQLSRVSNTALACFALAFARAVWIKKLCSFATLKASVLRSRRTGGAATAARAERAMEQFYAIKPLFFATHDRCLLNSLTLIYFLSHYGLFPRIAFGVCTAPFAAHCWVEDEALIYNDQLGNVRGYAPILRI